MSFFKAIARCFRRRTAYERLCLEWITLERQWREEYTHSSKSRQRELLDMLREERRRYFSRKLELESAEQEQPYKPVVYQPPAVGSTHIKTVGQLLAEKGYGLHH